MAGSRRGGRRNATPLMLAAVAAILIGLVLVSLRLLPGSPLQSTAASHWGEPTPGRSTGEHQPSTPASPSLRRALWATLRRDLLVTARHRSDAVTGLVFFVVVASLFPLGVGSDTRLLREIGPGVVWVAALLAMDRDALDLESARDTIGVVLKAREDVEAVLGERLGELVASIRSAPG